MYSQSSITVPFCLLAQRSTRYTKRQVRSLSCLTYITSMYSLVSGGLCMDARIAENIA